MRGILTLFFTLLISISFGQTLRVKGYCVDRRGVPIDNVIVYSPTAIEQKIYTDSLGYYELAFREEGEVQIIYRTASYEERLTVNVKSKKTKVGDVVFPFQQEAGVNANGIRIYKPGDIDDLKRIDYQMLPSANGVEQFLVLTTVARSNNELTTNYNVQGGSFLENLVLVNGFNIYRPFLTRSGQQEGMSFINSALVESIKFSGGGFAARYGDKMSSVLDITYKSPATKEFSGSLMASLLGVELHVAQGVGSRFNYIVGARYRSNGYLLNALPTQGAYNPVFWDAQFLTNFDITENLKWSVIGHFSSNNYRFKPETQETDFGTANEAYSFKVYFEGQEETQFTTMLGGTSLKWEVDSTTHLDFYATVFNTVEQEYFDILGEYYINELETDPSKEEFGDSIAVLGVGGFLNHARNKLNATIINIYHHGDHTFRFGFKDTTKTKFRSHTLKWGLNFQMDDFYDQLSEWKMVDSAGFSLPQSGNDSEIVLFETVKGEFNLQSQRYTGYVEWNAVWKNNQFNKIVSITKKYRYKDEEGIKHKVRKTFVDTIYNSPSRWTMSFGARSGYTTVNSEFYVTPRMVLRYYPRAYMVKDEKIRRRNVNIHLSTGLYYQPPFYREFRTFDGQLNLDVLAQKSAHIVAGTDVYFGMWGRESPFKFTAEAFYKYMWDINSYEIDNVRTRFYANNDAKAYAYGIDLNINGQFVKGIESFFKIGFLRTEEDVLTDYYYDYFNESGDKIIFGISEDQTVTDSLLVEPGYIPRPTDQWISFGALVQDRMPGKFESFSVQMGMQYGSRLPYGPPDFKRYKDTLRQKSYFRVDLGMSYDFLYKKKNKQNFFRKNFTTAVISFEVFNLLGVNNVLSKQWIQDTEGKYYSIPNYLTQRRFNLKLILRF
ncbi:MAG: TonB-dependent receptor plug domain-containing protein [Crocinitomicaceae bacterium]|nr:TonB-dependent receptor plug domain-containing protein [Crocinitomicaceae bacterium]